MQGKKPKEELTLIPVGLIPRKTSTVTPVGRSKIGVMTPGVGEGA